MSSVGVIPDALEAAIGYTARERLDLLVKVADLLGIESLDFCSYSMAISRMSSESLQCKRSLARLTQAEHELEAHLECMEHEEALILRWKATFEEEEKHGESSTSILRRKEALLKKAKEYRKELDTLTSQMPEDVPVTVSDIVSQQERIQLKEKEIKAKRARMKAFQGLPPSLDMARLELQRARDEQTQLIHLRERLLGRMADGLA